MGDADRTVRIDGIKNAPRLMSHHGGFGLRLSARSRLFCGWRRIALRFFLRGTAAVSVAHSAERGLEVTLGINQKVGRHHDLLAIGYAIQHLDIIVTA